MKCSICHPIPLFTGQQLSMLKTRGNMTGIVVSRLQQSSKDVQCERGHFNLNLPSPPCELISFQFRIDWEMEGLRNHISLYEPCS